jgi:cytochrome c1
MKTLRRNLLAVVFAGAFIAPAFAQEHPHDAEPPQKLKWSFAGPFGKYNQAQIQRGFKVYREVCSNCHSVEMLSFRNLAEAGGPGFSTAQAASVAAEYKVKDGPNDAGDMFERPGRLADAFPKPFSNNQAARASNGGALPPDFSVIAKARTYERGFPYFVFDVFTQYQEHGPDYIAAIIKGYTDAPKDMAMPAGMNFNKAFPGNMIGMPPPLQSGQVTFDDGAPQTLEQYSQDVSAFLMWVAEPHLAARKALGLQVMIFLIILAGLLYFTKKKVWKEVALDPSELTPRPPTEYPGNPNQNPRT